MCCTACRNAMLQVNLEVLMSPEDLPWILNTEHSPPCSKQHWSKVNAQVLAQSAINRAKLNSLPLAETNLPATGTHPCWMAHMRTLQRRCTRWPRESASHHPKIQPICAPASLYKHIDQGAPSPSGGQEQPITQTPKTTVLIYLPIKRFAQYALLPVAFCTIERFSLFSK